MWGSGGLELQLGLDRARGLWYPEGIRVHKPAGSSGLWCKSIEGCPLCKVRGFELSDVRIRGLRGSLYRFPWKSITRSNKQLPDPDLGSTALGIGNSSPHGIRSIECSVFLGIEGQTTRWRPPGEAGDALQGQGVGKSFIGMACRFIVSGYCLNIGVRCSDVLRCRTEEPNMTEQNQTYVHRPGEPDCFQTKLTCP